MLVLLVLGVLLAISTAKVDFTGHQVWRVQPFTQLQIKQLAHLVEQYDFWKEDFSLAAPADIRVTPDDQELLHSYLKKSGIGYTVMIQDVQRLIDSESQFMQKLKPLENFRDLDLERYYQLDEINAYLEEQEEAFDEVERFTTGQSYEGRDIWGVKISGSDGDDDDRKAVLLDCGIHAREWISPAICLYAIDQLLNAEIEDIETVREGFDWYVYPSVNPDGYAYTWSDNRMWRKTRSPNEGSTCMGTDGNRNFWLGWGGTGSSNNPCSETYHGSSPGSEIEIQNLDNFIQGLNGDDPFFELGITIHSYGQFMVYGWGYTTDIDPPNADDLDEMCVNAEAAIEAVHGSDWYFYRSGGVMSGNTIDWAMNEGQMKYTFLYESRDTGEYGFILPPEQIKDTVEETFAGIMSMALDAISKR